MGDKTLGRRTTAWRRRWRRSRCSSTRARWWRTSRLRHSRRGISRPIAPTLARTRSNAAQAGYLKTLSQTPGQVSTGTTGAIDPAQLSNAKSVALYESVHADGDRRITADQPTTVGDLAKPATERGECANAFGGTRQAVQQGVTQAQGALGMGQMASQLYQANFSQAQAAATGDRQRVEQAKQGNQAAQAADYGRSLDAQKANQSAGLTQEQLTNAGARASARSARHQSQRRQLWHADLGRRRPVAAGSEQHQLQMAKFNEAWHYPHQQLATCRPHSA